MPATVVSERDLGIRHGQGSFRIPLPQALFLLAAIHALYSAAQTLDPFLRDYRPHGERGQRISPPPTDKRVERYPKTR